MWSVKSCRNCEYWENRWYNDKGDHGYGRHILDGEYLDLGICRITGSTVLESHLCHDHRQSEDSEIENILFGEG